MRSTNLKEAVALSTVMETAVKRVRNRLYKEIRDGYYVTCKGGDGFEAGTRWLVCPDEKTSDISNTIRDNKTYRLLYARTPVAPELRNHGIFFSEERIVNGAFLKEHFVKGDFVKAVRIVESDTRLCRYYAYDIYSREEVAKGNDFDAMLDIINAKGYHTVRIYNRVGKEEFIEIG